MDTLRLKDNTELIITGEDGKQKKAWQTNALGRFLRKRFQCIRMIPFVTGYNTWVAKSHNTITNIGHAGAVGRIGNVGSFGAFVNMGIGVNASTPNALDQALGQEIISGGGSRGAATATQQTTTITNDTLQLVKTFTFTASFTVTEEAIFDSATSPSVTTTTQSRINTDTTVTVASGTGFTNGDFIQWDNEIVSLTSGGGSGTFTIVRAQRGTTAVSHASGVGMTDINTSANCLAKQAILQGVASGDTIQLTHKITG